MFDSPSATLQSTSAFFTSSIDPNTVRSLLSLLKLKTELVPPGCSDWYIEQRRGVHFAAVACLDRSEVRHGYTLFHAHPLDWIVTLVSALSLVNVLRLVPLGTRYIYVSLYTMYASDTQ